MNRPRKQKRKTVSGVKWKKATTDWESPKHHSCALYNPILPRKSYDIKHHSFDVQEKGLSDSKIHQELAPPFDSSTPCADGFSGTHHPHHGPPGQGKPTWLGLGARRPVYLRSLILGHALSGCKVERGCQPLAPRSQDRARVRILPMVGGA